MTATVVRETTHTLYPSPAEGAVTVTVRVVHYPAGTRTLAHPDGGPERHACFVTVKCLPGYAWWSCPDARTLRRLVDTAAGAHGLRRDGVRLDHRGGPVTEWRFTYPLV